MNPARIDLKREKLDPAVYEAVEPTAAGRTWRGQHGSSWLLDLPVSSRERQEEEEEEEEGEEEEGGGEEEGEKKKEKKGEEKKEEEKEKEEKEEEEEEEGEKKKEKKKKRKKKKKSWKSDGQLKGGSQVEDTVIVPRFFVCSSGTSPSDFIPLL